MTAAPEARARRDLPFLAALALLVFVYAPALATRYYMRDEFLMVQDVPPGVAGIGYVAVVLGWKSARPLAYPFYGVYAFVEARGGLWWIRLSQLVMSLGAAWWFRKLLCRLGLSPTWAAALVLFLWSQPAFVVYTAYLPMAPYWMGVCGAWLAFRLVCDDAVPLTGRRLVAAGLLLFAGWITFQAAPFCAFPLLALHALSTPPGRWPVVRARYARFAGVWAAMLALYVAATKAMLAVSQVNLTPPVRRAFELLSGADLQEYAKLLEPTNLLSPFEWWNYLLAVPALSDRTYLALTGATAAAWCATIGAAYARERRDATHDAGPVTQRWAAALAAVAVAWLPVALEGLKDLHRQHVAIAVVPALALVFAYAARALAPGPRARRVLAPAGVGLLLAVVLGARASLERGIVAPHAAAQAFVEDAMRRQADLPATRMVVVNAQETACLVEPCRGLYGRTAWLVSRHDYPKFLRRLAQEVLGRPGMTVEYVEPADPRAQDSSALQIDFRRFAQRGS